MKTQIIASVDGLIGVNNGFWIIESCGLTDPIWFDFQSPAGLFTVGTDAIACHVENDFTHYSLVALEAWSGRPLTSGPPNSQSAEGTVRFSQPEVRALVPFSPEPESGILKLTGKSQNFRLCRWGSDAIGPVQHANPNSPIHLVEMFLVQFWPSGNPETSESPSVEPHSGLERHNRTLRDWALGRVHGTTPPGNTGGQRSPAAD